MEPGVRATALVALATTEGRPTARATGKETMLPPPATELMAPATAAAPARAAASAGVKGAPEAGQAAWAASLPRKGETLDGFAVRRGCRRWGAASAAKRRPVERGGEFAR